jgi:adenosylhomocysteine nucleosidase
MMTASTSSAIAGPVCLVTALAQEHAVVRKCMGGDNDSLVTVQSGIGRAAGFIAAEEASRMHPSLAGLVSIGFCGGLAPHLRSGAIVVPSRIITPGTEESFSADAGWHARVTAHLATLNPETEAPLYSANDMLDTTAAKRAVHEQRQACAVDMESAGIAHAARRLQVPFLAIRIVLDEAGDSLPRATANAVHANGNLNARGLVSGLVRNPKDVPALMALGRKSSLAQKRLKAVCEALTPGFLIGR